MSASRAAVEEGIVPGGGLALLRASTALSDHQLEGDQIVGAKIVRKALEAPIRRITENAGEESSVVVAKIKDNEEGYGFNAQTGEYEDLLQAGIVDPTKVVRSALQNAASVGGLLLTTESLITEIEEEPKPEAGGAQPHHGHFH